MAATRVQLALNVDDLATTTEFYSKLFGVQPHKQRPGYANFSLDDPPLKLVLIEDPGAGERLNHLGVEAVTADQVSAALARFKAAGLTTRVALQDLCCHAIQDKVFVTAPDVPPRMVGVLPRDRRRPRPRRGDQLGMLRHRRALQRRLLRLIADHLGHAQSAGGR